MKQKQLKNAKQRQRQRQKRKQLVRVLDRRPATTTREVMIPTASQEKTTVADEEILHHMKARLRFGSLSEVAQLCLQAVVVSVLLLYVLVRLMVAIAGDVMILVRAICEMCGTTETMEVTEMMNTHDTCGSSTASSIDTLNYYSLTEGSTIIYGHIPFNDMEAKARILVQCIFVKTYIFIDEKDINAYPIRGGSYNRIIGLDVHAYGRVEKNILRLPRFSDADVSSEVATLRFLEQKTKLPVPHVVDFSFKVDSFLQSAYTLQSLMPGTSLFKVYPTLNFGGRARVARHLGKCLQEILKVQSGTAGRLVFGNPHDRLDNRNWKLRTVSGSASSTSPIDIGVKPFVFLGRPQRAMTGDGELAEIADGEILQEQPPDPIALSMILMLQERKREYSEHTGNEEYRMSLMDRLCGIVSSLQRFGYLAPDACGRFYTLAHLDFAPRNILADYSTKDSTWNITGILDWDSAIMAPIFVACSPPVWLWRNWGGGTDGEHQFTSDASTFGPLTGEGEALKQIFDETVGAQYCEYAYSDVYRLARRLFYFAKDGIQTSEDFHNVEYLMQWWQVMSSKLKKPKM